jgi:hypothetical protein
MTAYALASGGLCCYGQLGDLFGRKWNTALTWPRQARSLLTQSNSRRERR